MSAAALVLLAAGVGVGYGWQPMSDGSDRYEYIVQVEPELLETLREGRSIPIVSDVPEGVGPIGRIRITVGRGDLPRQRLVTDLKPPTDASASADNGILLTQYSQPAAAPPYASVPSSIDAAVNSWNGSDSVSAAVQQATDNVLRAATGQAAPATNSAATTWNGGVAPAAPAGSSTMDKVNEGLNQVTQPLRDGMAKVDDSVRDAASSINDQTRKLANDLTQPFTGGTTAPLTLPAPPAATAAPTWGATPQATAAPTAARSNEPTNVWNDGQAAAPTVTSAPAVTAAPIYRGAPQPTAAAVGTGAAPSPGNNIVWPAAAPPTAPSASSQRLDQQIDPRDVGRWDSRQPAPTAAGVAPTSQPVGAFAAPPLTATSGPAGSTTGQPRLTAPTNSLPSGWPGSASVAPTAGEPPAPFGGSTAGVVSSWPGATANPSIDKGMLAQPGNRQLDNIPGNLPTSAFPAGSPLASSTPSTLGAAPGVAPNAAAGQGWDFGTRPSGALPTAPNLTASPTAANGSHAAAVLAAWVLLTGSVAGNLYLFWSYLDVRTKYRALVRKTARAVGSRFSAA